MSAITACSAPADFAGFEEDDGFPGFAGFGSEVAGGGGAGYAATDDDDVGGAREMRGGAVTEEGGIRFGVPEGGRGGGDGEAGWWVVGGVWVRGYHCSRCSKEAACDTALLSESTR